MRIAVLPNVCGNEAALEAVLAEIDALVVPPDRIVFSGELKGSGPHPKRVVKLAEKRAASDPQDSIESLHDALKDGVEKFLFDAQSCGYPTRGDPRASFSLITIADGASPRLEHIHVGYAVTKTARAMFKKADRGGVEPKQALDYLRGLLGDEKRIGKDPKLAPELAGSELSVALLATRIHKVYGLGSLDWPDDDVEHVHDLRVATRRMREAMAIASRILPEKRVRRANRRARSLGRAFGERRICDVFLEEVKKIAAEQRLELSSFITFLEARRDRATIEVCLHYSKRKLLRHGLDLLELSMSPSDRVLTLKDIAPAHLLESARIVEELLPCIEDENMHDEHHELRIKLKHLRYSSEILCSAWPSSIDPAKTVAPIKELQDDLGVLNDARELVHLAKEHGESGELTRFCEHVESQRASRFAHAQSAVKAMVPAVLTEIRTIAQSI